LASFYQDDIVEEDDIRAWHKLPTSRMSGTSALAENMNRTWSVGSRMLQQFDEQEDEDSEESEEEDSDTE
jgi:translation initiation factor eIF-2B subunit epsilon